MEDKIINNRFDNVEYGTEGLRPGTISIHPKISDRYEESVSENIEDVYMWKKLQEQLYDLYKQSEFYEKYGEDNKKLEKRDVADVYYYFKHKLLDLDNYSIVQVFCAIAEFFDLNYKTLYNDIVSLEDKADLIETLVETHGLEKSFANAKRLF